MRNPHHAGYLGGVQPPRKIAGRGFTKVALLPTGVWLAREIETCVRPRRNAIKGQISCSYLWCIFRGGSRNFNMVVCKCKRKSKRAQFLRPRPLLMSHAHSSQRTFQAYGSILTSIHHLGYMKDSRPKHKHSICWSTASQWVAS
jgi:hypothetical protein